MIQQQSALSALISELLDDPDLAHEGVFRKLLQAGLQDLIDAEATATIDAGRYERTQTRSTRRNGTRSKRLATPAGELDLAIPKLRSGSFYPALLHPRRRVDKALRSVICTAWIDVVSTRKVDDLVRALGNESGISKSQVSRVCGEIDEFMTEFLHRRLDHTWFPLSIRSRGSHSIVPLGATDRAGRGQLPSLLGAIASRRRLEVLLSYPIAGFPAAAFASTYSPCRSFSVSSTLAVSRWTSSQSGWANTLSCPPRPGNSFA